MSERSDELKPGDLVRYHGSIRVDHGEWVVLEVTRSPIRPHIRYT